MLYVPEGPVAIMFLVVISPLNVPPRTGYHEGPVGPVAPWTHVHLAPFCPWTGAPWDQLGPVPPVARASPFCPLAPTGPVAPVSP